MESQFASILSELGIGMLSSGLYDVFKGLATGTTRQDEYAKAIQDCIDLHGVSMKAETVISALADHGLLSIQGSDLYADEAILFGSQGGTAQVTGSTLKTPKTEIYIGAEASIQTQGNGHIRQNPDGSISFHT